MIENNVNHNKHIYLFIFNVYWKGYALTDMLVSELRNFVSNWCNAVQKIVNTTSRFKI